LFVIIPVLWLSYTAYLSGDSGFSTFYSIFYGIEILITTIVQIWNPISLVLPFIMTIVNIFLKMLWNIIAGFVGIACTKLPFDPGFDPVTDCPTLWDWLNITQNLSQIIYALIQFLLDIIDKLGYALYPGTCPRRNLVSNVDPTCAKMCIALGESPGCFNWQNALTWIFTGTNFWEFIVNYFDFFFGIPLVVLLRWISEELYVDRLVRMCPESCYNSLTDYAKCVEDNECTEIVTIFQMITIIATSESKIITVFFLSMVVQVFASPIDIFYCNLLTPAIGPCLIKKLCYLILPDFLDDTCELLAFAIHTCPCDLCENAWTSTTAIISPPGILGPCTMMPGCPCNPTFTFLAYLVNYINSLL
jgi:hypothetical protein